MAIYLKVDGINGDATHENHKQWIDVTSLNWNANRGVNTVTGSAVNREASEPSISDVTITKTMDTSSAHLFELASTGNKGKKVEIHLVTTGSPGDTYMEYTLENALVSNYSVSTTGDRPIETVSFNFTKMQMRYTPYDENHSAGSPITAGYDLATTKKS